MNVKPTKKIEVMNGEMVLTIQPTNEAFMRKLLIELGDPEALIRPNALVAMRHDKRVDTVHAADKLLDYCMGWGVVDDAPADMDLSELAFVMSNDVKNNLNNQYMRRSYWLRFIINDFQGLPLSDQSTLVAEITALTLGVEPNYNVNGNANKRPLKPKPTRSPRTSKK